MTPAVTRVLTVVTRTLALVIALLGAVDPVLTLSRPLRPTVALIDPEIGWPESRALTDRVARAIEGDYVVIRAPLASAAGVVVVGDRLPSTEVRAGTPAMVVLPDRATTSIAIERVDTPRRASIESRVPVAVTIHVTGARGRRVETTLSANNLAVDTASQEMGSDAERFVAKLGVVPAGAGPVTLSVTSRIVPPAGVKAMEARADTLVDIERRIWRVLFFDRRPSWASTFVRRVLEDDRRFEVVSRIETSRAVSTATGGAPLSLADASALAPFAAVVVGAPDALTSADTIALEKFSRDRGGVVVLLMEKRAAGPVDRLLSVPTWRDQTRTAPVSLESGGLFAPILASEFAWPAQLPAGATALATVGIGIDALPVIWRSPLGAGALVVSGALDTWRFRAAANTDFSRFWLAVIGEAAAAAPAPLDVSVEAGLLRPGQTTRLRAMLLEPPAAPVAITASLSDNSAVQLWPENESGSFGGILRAPAEPGTYRVKVVAGALESEASIVVARDVASPQPDERELATAWATAHGGAAIEASDLSSLSRALDKAIQPARAPQPVRPMRSPWWIVPFVLALGIEWAVRRRGGRS